MQKVNFSKYEGAGNDFIIIDDRSLDFPKQEIPRLCNRRFGIGADGLILVQPEDKADVRMRIFNADGSEAEGCGNGLRCLIQYLSDRLIAQGSLQIAVGGRLLSGECVPGGISIEMGAVQEMKRLEIDGREIYSADTGVPHAVLFVPDVKGVCLTALAPPLRYHALFPRGTNVSVANRGEGSVVAARTYERGVEGETLACGTGAVAIATLGALHFGWTSPVAIRFAGGDLSVEFDQAFLRTRLTGPARFIFDGVFAINRPLA